MHIAVQRKSGDVLDVLDLLIKQHVDINAQTLSDADTAIHIVLRYAELDPAEEIVLKLLENGADPDIRNGVSSVLQTGEASRCVHFEIMLTLCTHVHEVIICSQRLRSPYDYAIDRGYVGLARALCGDVTLPMAIKDSMQRRKQYWAVSVE